MLQQKKGHIVTMASVASFVAAASMVDYAATKAGLMAFHEGKVLCPRESLILTIPHRIEM